MYEAFYGMRERPFALTPDPAFLYLSAKHSSALSMLEYSLTGQAGFTVVTGEIGSGKTTLIQKLLSELGEDILVAKVFQTQLDEVEFLQAVLVELGLDPFDAKKVELLDMLNGFLVKQFQRRRQIVLIVDDAHNLNMKVLEEIRMLAGLEARKEKLLHVILVGQPQLDEILDDPRMDQLKQRVKLRYHIRALNDEEIGAYVRHRLGVAGAKNRTLFQPATLPIIANYAGGIPRLINLLCDMALTCAYADGQPEVTVDVMESAIKELQWPTYAERIERHRRQAPSIPPENAMLEALREQTGILATIAGQTGKIEHLAPTLESIGKSLSAIEAYLRSLTQQPGTGLRLESTVDRRKKTG
jgi:type II secretory pathway predicted ATPase ExeA